MTEIIWKVRRADVRRGRHLGLMLVLTLVSCVAAVVAPREGYSPPFSEQVLESLLGSTKDEVDEQLGKPAYQAHKDDKSYYVYSGNIKTAGLAVGVPTVPIWDYTRVCSLLEFGSDERLKRYERRGGSGVWVLVVGVGGAPRDCRSAFWSSDEIRALEKTKHTDRVHQAQSNAEACLKVIRTGAPDCDAETLYNSARGLSLLDGWLPTCLAAHMGHPQAQYRIGKYFAEDKGEESIDLVKAYLWYSLAEAGFQRAGSTSGSIYRKTSAGLACCFPKEPLQDSIAKQLSEAQLEEAEHLVAEWEPNPAGCEEIATQDN